MDSNEPWPTEKRTPFCFIEQARFNTLLSGHGLLNPRKKLNFSSSQFGVNVKSGEILPVIQF